MLQGSVGKVLDPWDGGPFIINPINTPKNNVGISWVHS